MNQNPKLNASGYRDMTAYTAINNVSREKYPMKMEKAPSINNIKTTKQHIEHVELSKCVPTEYQRLTSEIQVKKIAGGFKEAKLGVLTVSLRDGKYHIIDGLHRAKALKILGYTHAPCIVLTGLTYEQEADFFRKQNENKRIITTFDDFKAGLEAKDEMCLNINKILNENEFQIGRGGFFKISSIHALFTIVKDFGYDTLNDTLFLLANTWSDIKQASRSEFLLGTAEFVYRYGIAEFSERLKGKFAVICYDYAEAMRVRGSIGSAASRKKFCQIQIGRGVV